MRPYGIDLKQIDIREKRRAAVGVHRLVQIRIRLEVRTQQCFPKTDVRGQVAHLEGTRPCMPGQLPCLGDQIRSPGLSARSVIVGEGAQRDGQYLSAFDQIFAASQWPPIARLRPASARSRGVVDGT